MSLKYRFATAVTAAILAAPLLLSCSSAAEPALTVCDSGELPSEAVVTIAWRDSPDEMHVLVRNQTAVRAACNYIAAASTANIPAGRIAVGSGPADPRVPFHYVPETVQFVQVAIELCDSALLRTTAEVEAYFAGTSSDLSGTAPYCPWAARPVDVRTSR